MTWDLILTFFHPERETVSIFYGQMVSEVACHFAGRAMSEALVRLEPLATILVTCRPGSMS